MDVNNFLSKIEGAWGKALQIDQTQSYREKLFRFSGEQREQIFSRLLETCKFLPKISDIYDAARDLNYLETPSPHFKPVEWQSTDCKLCHGEGRLAVVKQRSYIKASNGDWKPESRMVRISAYSDYNTSRDRLGESEYRFLYRCKCAAAELWNKAIPQWV